MKRILSQSILNLLLVFFSIGVIIFCGMAVRADCRYRSGRETYEKIRLAARGGQQTSPAAFTDNVSSQLRNAPGLPDGGQRHFAAIDEGALKKQNADYLFWLYIPGTEIDYPVVRHEDNQYYLNHTFLREENPCGSIFADSGTVTGLEENTVINGHNMRDGSMLGGLKKYEKQQYFQEHPDLWIYCGGRWVRGRIFSCRIAVDGNREAYQTCFGPGEKAAYLAAVESESLYDTGIRPGEEDRLVTLSTCRGSRDKLLVQAVLEEME